MRIDRSLFRMNASLLQEDLQFGNADRLRSVVVQYFKYGKKRCGQFLLVFDKRGSASPERIRFFFFAIRSVESTSRRACSVRFDRLCDRFQNGKVCGGVEGGCAAVVEIECHDPVL